MEVTTGRGLYQFKESNSPPESVDDLLNCSNLIVVLLYGPSYISLYVTFGCSGWSMILNCMIIVSMIYNSTIDKVVRSVIYCHPDSGSLMSCGVRRIWGVISVVCHGGLVAVSSVC